LRKARKHSTPLKILGIETSCDETAAAVVESGRVLHSNVVASQVEIHAQFGGIVPEVASRQHIIAITGVVRQALVDAAVELKELDGIAVTSGPGLAGSLLVGVNAAKGLALAADLPVWGVNHLEGHVYATWLGETDPAEAPGFPLMCLIVSGGHTDLALMTGHSQFELVGRTRDDAAGEAFDKAARVLGLPYPGGPEIQRVAADAERTETPFTRPRVKGSRDFSYSGLKTAVLHRARERGVAVPSGNKGVGPRGVSKRGDGPTGDVLKEDGPERDRIVSEIAAAFQDAVVDTLVGRTLATAEEYGCRGIVVCGGVAANAALRESMSARSTLPVFMPRPSLCTDNGAMIAAAGFYSLTRTPDGQAPQEWDMDVIPGLEIGAPRHRSA
jgi:N6-L-threonylcarbamoyladenine synthase